MNEKNSDTDKVEIVYNINNNTNNLDLSTGNDNSIDENFKFSHSKIQKKKLFIAF